MQNDHNQEQLDLLFQKLDEALANHNEEQPHQGNAFRLKAISTSLNIIAKNLQEAIDETGAETKIPPKTFEETIVQKLHDYIMNNLHEPLPSVATLAKSIGTNPKKLSDSFRKVYKTGVYRYFITQRLELAKTNIINTHLSLKEIATVAGFNNYHTFYSAFLKEFGYTPASIRTTAT